MFSKPYELLTIIFLFSFGSLNAQWQTVGSPNFSNGSMDVNQSIAFNPTTNEPYVLFHDIMASSNSNTVMKFTSGSWQSVGTINALGWCSNLVFNPLSSEPYFAYDNNNGLTVVKYASGSWQTVGTTGFADGIASNLAFNPITNELYIAYRDLSDGSRVSVMKYSNGSWQQVGFSGFSAGVSNGIKLAFHTATNEPYVVYRDGANNNKTSVMKFSGSTWQYVGGQNLPAEGGFQNITFHPLTNEPYIIFRDGTNGGVATVMKYSGSSWQNVGGNISNGNSSTHKITFHPITHEPYIFFSDLSGLVVKKYSSGSWNTIGASGFSDGTFGDLAFHPTTNIPYVVFSSNSNSTTVMNYNSNPTNNPPVNIVAPTITGNPTDGQTLHLSDGTWTDADNDPLTYSYQWYRDNNNSGNNGTLIPGATNNTYTLTASDVNNYIYASVTADDGIDNTLAYSNYTNQVSTSVSIKLINNEDLIILSPNPFNDRFNINYKGTATIRIFDITGKLITRTQHNNNTQINLSERKGVYIIEVSSAEGTSYYKMIKQ